MQLMEFFIKFQKYWNRLVAVLLAKQDKPFIINPR